MNITIKDGLPFIEVELIHEGKIIKLENVLLDTGSASTIISTDIALDLGLGPSPEDELFRIRGVGGSEYVYEKSIEKIKLETAVVSNLKIDIGAMNYGFDIDAILGMNFLVSVGLIIDISKMTVYSVNE
ncbi:retropepsin-like aspartic protease [Proteiniborus sp.]|uniref:retropepsin-like aspartic protease n=1 Tax=Proteiniborus sp. TaxID=2079015 RepID=UPI003319C2D7